MQKDALNNVHISAEQILITPEELKLRFPLGINDETNIAEARKTIADIVHGRDPRLDLGSANIGNGRWLLDIDGDVDVYDVARLPGNRLKITSQATTFDCNVDDVKALGQVFITLERNL